ncbi:MAG: amidohydrolase family protein [Pseudomonadota bacterium]
MSHDLVIRGGSVVDGTGAQPYNADIAIDGNEIVDIGSISAQAKREVDANGLTVTPGFVDLHTHLDAQIGWDPQVTSISWHGVTTALLGNCGVTFAPCKPDDRGVLAAMMETVEDIPRRAILEGLPWNWESYGEYLNSIEAMGPGINVCGMVGHCALRFYVMGDRGVDEPEGNLQDLLPIRQRYNRESIDDTGDTGLRRPTEDEIKQIARLAGQSVKEGAIGFSTNRMSGHQLPDGRAIPGTYAHRDELRAIAREVGAYGGIMQTVFGIPTETRLDDEFELLEYEARVAQGALFSSNVEMGVGVQDAKVQQLLDEGLNVASVTVPRSGGGVGGLLVGNFFRSDSWRKLHDMEPGERLQAIRDHDFRIKLIDEIKHRTDGKATKRWFFMGNDDRPHYAHRLDESLYDMAQAAGEHPVETWLRLTDESDGKALFHMRGFNVDLDGVEALIQTDWVVPAQGDAGAHVSQMNDSGCSSFVLSHWVRDRGTLSLPDAVRKLTAMPANLLGLTDRGVLQVGKKADLNVIDIDRVAERQPEIVNDMPFGAPRFIQRGTGYRATVCNGVVTLENDELTGDYGGRVLRSYDR